MLSFTVPPPSPFLNRIPSPRSPLHVRSPIQLCCTPSEPPPEPPSEPPSSHDQSEGKKRHMSAESRAKISAALRGKRKSDAHRENLRKRLSGEQNPMYGRKLSAETRAKISKSMAARKRGGNNPVDSEKQRQTKANEPPGSNSDDTVADGEEVSDLGAAETLSANDDISEATDSEIDSLGTIGESENLERWRERAQESRLLKSFENKDPNEGKRRRRLSEDSLLEEEIDQVLQRVARMDLPPEHVARLIHKTHFESTASETDEDEDEDYSDDEVSLDGLDASNKRAGRKRQEKPNPTIEPIDFDKLKFRPETRGRRKFKKSQPVSKKDPVCQVCTGSGMVSCTGCIKSIGVVSSRCSICFGTGHMFCQACNGSGRKSTRDK